MKASERKLGRVFVIRLEDGDLVPTCLERFAEEKGISTGHVILIGGIGGGEVVVGPRNSEERPPQPLTLPVDSAHDVVGVGIIAPGANGKPHWNAPNRPSPDACNTASPPGWWERQSSMKSPAPAWRVPWTKRAALS